MNPERKEFLTLKTLPARLTVEEAAWFLGFSLHDVPILVSAGLLKPLGHPRHNAPKYFATTTLEPLRNDLKWLAKSCDAIVCYWRKKNMPKTGNGTEEAESLTEMHGKNGYSTVSKF